MKRLIQKKDGLKIKSLIVCLLALFLATDTSAQAAKKEKNAANTEAVHKLIESRHYTCTMRSVTPSGGRMKQLSPGYSVTVAGDSLISNLPYFGTSHIPSTSSGDGYMFTSAAIEYEISNRKKGGWDVRIKTKDQQENPEFRMTIFEGGSASVYVTSISRSSISYSGEIVAK